MIYLDNAATTYPKPRTVLKTLNRTCSSLGANPGRSGYKMAVDTSMAVYEVRKKVATFFNASCAENVVFTKNCTEALNIVLLSKLKKGDHVLVSDIEHNAVMRPLVYLERQGVEFSTFIVDFKSDDNTIKSIKSKIQSNTKMIVCTTASNVFGFRPPIKQIGEVAKDNKIDFCLDAAQGAGIFEIDMKKQNIDFLCAPSHKGLMGIMGCGVLVANKKVKPIIYGGTGGGGFEQPIDMPDCMESGTVNVPGILCLGAGIDFINRIGLSEIERKESEKIALLYEKLKDINEVILYTDYPSKEKYAPLMSFNILGKNPEEVGLYLAEKDIAVRCGFHCAPSAHRKMRTSEGTVRIAPSVFTTTEELSYFVSVIKKYV